jgi:hypothetical protein
VEIIEDAEKADDIKWQNKFLSKAVAASLFFSALTPHEPHNIRQDFSSFSFWHIITSNAHLNSCGELLAIIGHFCPFFQRS